LARISVGPIGGGGDTASSAFSGEAGASVMPRNVALEGIATGGE